MSFGGGVTAIAVHEGGIPRFVRVLGTGGRELTDAIAADLDIPPETAEALKRQLGADGARRARRPGAHRDRASARRCCSTKSAARSTTTATSPARRGCCASS